MASLRYPAVGLVSLVRWKCSCSGAEPRSEASAQRPIKRPIQRDAEIGGYQLHVRDCVPDHWHCRARCSARDNQAFAAAALTCSMYGFAHRLGVQPTEAEHERAARPGRRARGISSGLIVADPLTFGCRAARTLEMPAEAVIADGIGRAREGRAHEHVARCGAASHISTTSVWR